MPEILGPDGRPARLTVGELAERTARPALVGLRRAQQWRSVVSDLTPDRLRAIYRAVAQGTWCPDYFELAEEIEERDAHYRAVLQQRALGAAARPLDALAASPAAADVRLADALRTDVLHEAGFHGLVLDLLDAVGKGLACVEVVWARRGGRWRPAGYHRIDPRWIALADDGETPLLIGGGDAGKARPPGPAGPLGAAGWGLDAQPLQPGKHIWHVHRSKAGLAVRGGLAYVVATLWLLKSAAVRDWWSFAEIYGLPVRVGRYGQHATDRDIQTLVQAIATLASDAGCVIPESMQIEMIESASRGGRTAGLFERMAAWCDQQTSKAVLGQTMTTDDGSSLGQAAVHAEVRADLLDDDIRQVGATLSRTLAAWYAALNFGRRPAGWPRVGPPPSEREFDHQAVAALARAGLEVPADWVRERMGIPAPREGEAVLTGVPAGMTGRPARPRARREADDDDELDDDEGDPGPALQARTPGRWRELARAQTAPVVAAAREAADPAGLVRRAGEAALPEALVDDLALHLLRARVAAEIDGEPAEGEPALHALGGAGPPLSKAAARFLRLKRRTPSTHYTDVWREEHAAAFTAAWLDRDDLVALVHRALVRSAARGETRQAFVAGLAGRLARAGWAPPRAGGDIPTRLARIYRINGRTAAAAGRWDRAVAAERRAPGQWFVRYALGPSEAHRPEHEAWAGQPTILPASDPWWRTHWPPNGWGCRCRAVVITRQEAERRGGPSAKAPPTATTRDEIEIADPRTGEIRTKRIRRTAGIDPGWDYNVGAFRMDGLNRAVTDHLDGILQGRSVRSGRPNAWAEVPLAERTRLVERRIAAHLQSDTFRSFMEPPKTKLRLDTYPPRFAAETPVAVVPPGVLPGDAAAAPELLRIQLATALKQAKAHGIHRAPGSPKGAVRTEDYREVRRLLSHRDAQVTRVEGELEWEVSAPGERWFLAISRNGGSLVLKTLHPKG